MTFDVNYYRPDRSPMQLMCLAMEHLMWPWNLGLVDVFMEQAFASGAYKFIITSSTFIDDTFVYEVDPGTLLQEEELAIDIAKKAAAFFLSLSEPIHDKIILGEN